MQYLQQIIKLKYIKQLKFTINNKNNLLSAFMKEKRHPNKSKNNFILY